MRRRGKLVYLMRIFYNNYTRKGMTMKSKRILTVMFLCLAFVYFPAITGLGHDDGIEHRRAYEGIGSRCHKGEVVEVKSHWS